MSRSVILSFVLLISIISCTSEADQMITPEIMEEEDHIAAAFGSNITLSNLANYSYQLIPDYITQDNTRSNDITDAGATLGRVLFYDTKVSVNNTISCASCHFQEKAFGDDAVASLGVNGMTGRHSMRLINTRFSEEGRFFWDERASSLEDQATMPIKDHIEMGFSGEDGDPGFTDLIVKLEAESYYKVLFETAFGDSRVTEERVQDALAQFIRSIQSFDSKYDVGRLAAPNDLAPFSNLTAEENLGKTLFMTPTQFLGGSGNRISGGLDCNSCHRAPEFSIDPNSRNNGMVGIIGDDINKDFSVTRSPSLRDLFNNSGILNGPLMHNGIFDNFNLVLNHYNNINAAGINNLDPKLSRGGGINLNITNEERFALTAFMKTLTGNNVYTDEKWTNPFIE